MRKMPPDPDHGHRDLRVARVCGMSTLLIGVVGITGWIFHLPVLTSIVPGYKPIAISAAVIFIILGGVQWRMARPGLSRFAGWLLLGITLCTVLFGLLETIQLISGLEVGIDRAILRHFPTLNANPSAQISPVAGVLVMLIGLAQSCLLYQQVTGRARPVLAETVGLLGSLVVLISTVFLLSYLYRTPLLYRTVYIPIAALATLAGLVSGIGVLAAMGDAVAPRVWFAGSSMRARLLRAFLPLTALLMLLLSIAQYLVTRFTALNPAILAPVIVIIFEVIITASIVQVAGAVGAIIERAESERRQAEEQLRRVNATLEERVHERTAELEASNQELEGFTYSVAHDLRSPLRSVDGFSRYLLEHEADRLDARGKEYLQRMRAAAQRMGRLIDDLLHLAWIGRRPLQRTAVDFSALATDIAMALHVREPERQLDITIMPHMVAWGDRELLSIALGHLLDNAWKFTRTRTDARIDVGESTVQGVQSYYVRDNGVGFDMAYVDKLFRPFQRLHTEQEFSGTGIGLATVQRIVQRHGGQVWAEGSVEHGATFHFTLGKEE